MLIMRRAEALMVLYFARRCYSAARRRGAYARGKTYRDTDIIRAQRRHKSSIVRARAAMSAMPMFAAP